MGKGRESLYKKGVDLKVLTRTDNETLPNIQKWLKVNKKIKQIENDGVAISIRDDSAIMVTLIKSNVTMLIRDKPFIALMKELFLNYYESAKPISS